MKKPISTRAYDAFGTIALFKFSREMKAQEKKKFALNFLRKNPSFKTILEKSEKFKGRLRTLVTKYLVGENTKEDLYHENRCAFRFHIDKTYFSPRLSNERKEVADLVFGRKNTLVICAGVGPYPIVIAKKYPSMNVVSVELNREASKYAERNVVLNKIKNVEVVQGNVKRVLPRFGKEKRKFDVVIMARPKLKDSFLKETFMVVKKGTLVCYYGFCLESEIEDMVEMIKSEALKSKKKIKILRIKKAGDIGAYRYRVRIDFEVL